MMNEKKQKVCAALLLVAICMLVLINPVTALANQEALNAVKSEINLFVELLAAVISGVGAAVTMWAFSKMGMAMQHGAQGGMEAQSFNAIIGGIIIILAPQLVVIFTS